MEEMEIQTELKQAPPVETDTCTPLLFPEVAEPVHSV